MTKTGYLQLFQVFKPIKQTCTYPEAVAVKEGIEIICHIKREITPHRFNFKHISRAGINLQFFLANLGCDSQSDEVYKATSVTKFTRGTLDWIECSQ